MCRTLFRPSAMMAPIALALLSSFAPATGQTKAASKAVAASPETVRSTYTPPRTADGQPDIQGIYGRAGIWDVAVQQFEANGPHGEENPIDGNGYNRVAPPSKLQVPDGPSEEDVKPVGENSRFIPLLGPPPAPIWRVGLVDPPNKILPWKPEEDKKRRAFLLQTSPAASIRHVEPDARCSLPGLFSNGGPFKIIQPEKEVIILSEYQHYTRTIHLDGRSHLGSSIRLFMGDSVGRWEGNKLIVDTTNFNEFTGFTRSIPYLSDALRTTEVFTIIDQNNIDYLVTVDDPKLFTGTWKTAGLYRKAKDDFQLVEYACSEGAKTLEVIFGPPPGK